jgi:hypothetical protein
MTEGIHPLSVEARLLTLREEVGAAWIRVVPEEDLLEMLAVLGAAVPSRGTTMRDATYRLARLSDKVRNEVRRRNRVERTNTRLRGRTGRVPRPAV